MESQLRYHVAQANEAVNVTVHSELGTPTRRFLIAAWSDRRYGTSRYLQ
jgi:hypothetical protein